MGEFFSNKFVMESGAGCKSCRWRIALRLRVTYSHFLITIFNKNENIAMLLFAH
jgi:hypothetical protein